MIKRKKKECQVCGQIKFIFSKGRCEYCAKLSYAKKMSKPKKKIRQKLSNLKRDARYWFQRYIRYKAFSKALHGVYCAYGCGKLIKSPKACDAGHYLKAELYPDAIFDEDNVHVVCKGCNIRDPLLEYRNELIRRHGEDFVLNLEGKYQLNRGTYKWDRSFLEDIKQTYKQKCKEEFKA